MTANPHSPHDDEPPNRMVLNEAPANLGQERQSISATLPCGASFKANLTGRPGAFFVLLMGDALVAYLLYRLALALALSTTATLWLIGAPAGVVFGIGLWITLLKR